MKKYIMAAMAAAAVIMNPSCTETQNNPITGEWSTPFQVPPFDKISIDDYEPAIMQGIEEHKKEIDAIVNNPDTPDFENTIAALDQAGSLLMDALMIFENESSINSSDALMAIEARIIPVVTAHSNEISLNETLFNRVKSVWDSRESLNLDPQQYRLLYKTYRSYELSGATLPEDKKAELKRLNGEIAQLQMQFGQNLLKETAAYTLVIDDEEDLSGLTGDQISEAASRAAARGMEGKWVFGLDNPSVIPFLTNADNRILRQQIETAYLNRCNNGNTEDNKDIIRKLASLRLEKARLMGYENFAQYALQDRMAKTPEAVYSLLDQVWKPAVEAAKRELEDMKPLAAADGVTELEPADWRYYFEKAKQAKYDLKETELMPYFQFENVRDGIFYVAEKLFGITFTKVEDIPVPHPEAIAFECKEADGSHLGILYMDMFARPGQKGGGAWCGGYREQHHNAKGENMAPVVTICGNFARATGDKPALLTVDEVETFFHEFGHALQSLLQNTYYQGVASVERDFVELPSQLNEHWAFEPEVLKVYARHYDTGEIIPQALVDKLDAAGKYGQGFATVEYVAASMLDMDWHVLTSVPDDLDVNAFEDKVLSERGILAQIPSRYRSTVFAHTFTGGYTAGYYSYLWAEVLDADAYYAFKETGDIFDAGTARKYRYDILASFGQEDAMDLYVKFRGKEPGIDPLLENRGLK